MRPILVKVYGNLFPVPRECYSLCEAVLQAWNLEDIEDILFYEKDMVRFSFEGDFFPCDEIVEVLKSFDNSQTEGKLDCIDVEEWTLTRHFFKKDEEYRVNTASLNHALEKQSL